jgi:hypothetical protein
MCSYREIDLRRLPILSNTSSDSVQVAMSVANRAQTEDGPRSQRASESVDERAKLAGRQGFEPRYRGPESGSPILVRFDPLRCVRFLAKYLRSAPVCFASFLCSLSHCVSLTPAVSRGFLFGTDR